MRLGAGKIPHTVNDVSLKKEKNKALPVNLDCKPEAMAHVGYA